MILRSPLDLRFPDLFFALDGFVSAKLYLKLEGFHLTGSIKIKTALFLMDDLEASGRGRPVTTTIVESSSGNLGAALSAAPRLPDDDSTMVVVIGRPRPRASRSSIRNNAVLILIEPVR